LMDYNISFKDIQQLFFIFLAIFEKTIKPSAGRG